MSSMTENTALDDDRILPAITKVTTPQQLVEEIAATGDMSSTGTVRIIDGADELHGYPVKRVELVTGGWSANEQLISELRATTFHLMWWSSSHRGGLHVYEVPVDRWERAEMLFTIGDPR